MSVTDLVCLAPGELRRDVVLRSFELLRRRTAVEHTGAQGASAGFPRLRFHDLPREAGTLVVRATVVDAGSRWQRVEYDATYRFIGADDTLVARIVARAVGSTCALPPTEPTIPAQREQSAGAARVTAG